MLEYTLRKTMNLISYIKIENWVLESLIKIGVQANDALVIARSLTKTSLWGTDSHGIARITHYLSRFENGTLNKTPRFSFHQTAPSVCQIDGDDGHGILIMTKATEKAIELAKTTGIASVGVSNSSHCGAIGLYTRQMTEAGMVGFSFTHADALVVPYGGDKPFFGTNPISIAFPTENKSEPICLDMATSIVPWNYVMNARRENREIPNGLGIDKYGNDCINPHEMIGVKPMADYKGYCLAFLIDMLCGPLNGMNYGPKMTSMYKDLNKKRKLGSLVIALNPDMFGGKETLKFVGTNIINHIRQHGENVLFPGQPEYITKTKREKEGIPMTDALLNEFDVWAEKLNIEKLR